ncbi:MAG: glycoside hydrolase family 16 protein [Eubacteriales bacterium]|nr:glycoside hydrolase family 16 protein [Eubacteriales bacterium]
MKRALLVIAGLLITAGISFYILGFSMKGESTPYEDDAETQAEAGDIVYVSEATETTMSMAAPAERTEQTVQTVQTERAVVIDGEWELVWADEFDKPSVDIEYWTEVERRDNYNNELQYYTPANSYIEDGCLYLTARDEKKGGMDYTSGMVETNGKLTFLYGRIEASVMLPTGDGLFPAFWMLTPSGDFEVDVMEMIGNEPNLFYGVNHYRRGSVVRKTFGRTTNETPEAFHVYALEWNEDELKWYIDGTLFYQTQEGVPNEEMYVIFTLAVGGVWPGRPKSDTVFPSSMAVDYVRLYRHI